MKTKLAISGALFAVAVVAACKVSPPIASALIFAFFMTASIACAVSGLKGVSK